MKFCTLWSCSAYNSLSPAHLGYSLLWPTFSSLWWHQHWYSPDKNSDENNDDVHLWVRNFDWFEEQPKLVHHSLQFTVPIKNGENWLCEMLVILHVHCTYFGSGHVLNSKLVSEPCKKFCFCYKLDPKQYQNFIEHKTLHQSLYTYHA